MQMTTLPLPRPPAHDFAPDSLEFQLFERLRAERRKLALQEGVPQYHILSNRDLADFVTVRPGNAEVLATVRGIGPHRAERWGAVLLEWMARHAGELGLPLEQEVPADRAHRVKRQPAQA